MGGDNLQLAEYIANIESASSRSPFVICNSSRDLPWITSYVWLSSEFLELPTESPKTGDLLFLAVRNFSAVRCQVDITFSAQQRKLVFPQLRANGQYHRTLLTLPAVMREPLPVLEETPVEVSKVESDFEIVKFQFAYRDPSTGSTLADSDSVVRFLFRE